MGSLAFKVFNECGKLPCRISRNYLLKHAAGVDEWSQPDFSRSWLSNLKVDFGGCAAVNRYNIHGAGREYDNAIHQRLEADVVSRLAHGRFEFQTAFGVVLRVLEQIKWARDLRGFAS